MYAPGMTNPEGVHGSVERPEVPESPAGAPFGGIRTRSAGFGRPSGAQELRGNPHLPMKR